MTDNKGSFPVFYRGTPGKVLDGRRKDQARRLALSVEESICLSTPLGPGRNGVTYSMSLPGLVLSSACCCLHKAHTRTSTRRGATHLTPTSPPTPHFLEWILQQSLPNTTSRSSVSLWPAPGAAPWCRLPQGF